MEINDELDNIWESLFLVSLLILARIIQVGDMKKISETILSKIQIFKRNKTCFLLSSKITNKQNKQKMEE